jgi:hypothetical protein
LLATPTASMTPCTDWAPYRPAPFLYQRAVIPEYAAFSPGVGLLHLVIEYLINDKRVTSINLAYGDPKLDSRSTTIVLDYASYWLFPRTLRNRTVRACYHTFRGSVAALKGLKSRGGRDPR